MVLLGWENSLGWLAFLSLIPFILLYFVRPKPVELEVPSLMFFMRSQHAAKENSFLKRFRFDLLFFLQLLILSLLALYFINPFTSLGGNILVDHAVFVLDTSASMQVDDRFSEAISLAQEKLARSNTFILVSNLPRIGAEDISKSDAGRFLKQLRVTAGRSNIGDALVLANQYIKGKDDQVYVISDFIPTEGITLEAANNALQSKNVVPQFLSVKGKKQHNNVGIVDLRLDDAATTVYFKNYNNQETSITYSVNDQEKNLKIKPQFIEPYSFKASLGQTEVRILDKDDLLADNVAYISVPEHQRLSVLLITDAPSRYLKAALQSSGKVDVTVTPSNKLPKESFDVYVLHEGSGKLNKDLLNALTAAVEDGKGLVIHAQANSNALDYGELLSLDLLAYTDDAVVEITQLTKLTKNIVFGDLRKYFVTNNEQGVTLAVANNASVLTVAPLGSGKIIYYGIVEEESEFSLQPSYPIFWTGVVRYLAGQGDLHDFNVETGSTLSLSSKKEVKTPSRIIGTNTLFFDEPGFYSYDTNVIAASLADELESNIDAISVENAAASAPLSTFTEEKRYNLEKIVLMLVGIFLFLELFFMKLRGEV